jgi:hypothetical protein
LLVPQKDSWSDNFFFFFFFKNRQKKSCQNSARDLSLLPVTTTERFACKTRTKIFSSSFYLAHQHHYQPSFSCWHREILAFRRCLGV